MIGSMQAKMPIRRNLSEAEISHTPCLVIGWGISEQSWLLPKLCGAHKGVSAVDFQQL
jgi:hypothetical protein